MLGAGHKIKKKCIIINFLNNAVNLQVGKPIFNLMNEKLGDKQRHFIGDCCGEVDIVFRAWATSVGKAQA
jgi:hypothetical protein